MLDRKKGQSTLEYITVFVAIVAVIVFVAFTVMRPAVNRVMGAAANKIDSAAVRFQNATFN
jgi:uncharacterized protein (UPF0333 family)